MGDVKSNKEQAPSKAKTIELLQDLGSTCYLVTVYCLLEEGGTSADAKVADGEVHQRYETVTGEQREKAATDCALKQLRERGIVEDVQSGSPERYYRLTEKGHRLARGLYQMLGDAVLSGRVGVCNTDEAGTSRLSYYRVSTDATLRTSEILLAASAVDAAQFHERAVELVAGEVGATVQEVEILEIDELRDSSPKTSPSSFGEPE